VRNEWQIERDILQSVPHVDKVTHLLYKSELSYLSLMKHMRVLLEKELIEQNEWYTVTPKGKEFIQLVDKIEEMIK
jgi:predicted transcriptional regulator